MPAKKPLPPWLKPKGEAPEPPKKGAKSPFPPKKGK